ncbi:pantetheine-phosphate adenylyltransferase [Alphaproteobacteria bacterium]|nr:pantetheine-phosphate adenylyltransferase [Alphaproteobacteria bacterium]
MRQRIVMYPGTFDPLTFGHIDIIQRAARLGDHLIVAVAENAGKSPVLSGDERCHLVETHLKGLIDAQKLPNTVSVKRFSTLLTDFAASEGVSAVIRGLRAVSDFEYEFQMASINKRLHGELETVFLMAAEQQHFVASRFVKEVARYGGDISSFVPNDIALALKAKMSGK